MKKIIVILVVAALFLIPFQAFAENNIENLGVSETEQPYDLYNEQINRIKTEEIRTAPYQVRSGISTVIRSCPTRTQITSFWCGLASAEQVIRATDNTHNLTSSYGSIYDPNFGYTVSGTYHQFTINNYLGGVGTGGASIYQITNAINHFSTGNFTWGYRYIPGSGFNAGQELLQYVMQTVGTNAKCCVIFADTYYYDYYGGQRYYHWVTLNGFTQSSGVAYSYHLVDPHYNVTYRGAHEELAQNVGDAIERYNEKPNLVW